MESADVPAFKRTVGVPVQVIKEIIRVSSSDEETSNKTTESNIRKRKSSNNGNRHRATKTETRTENIQKPTSPEATVLEFGTNKEIRRCMYKCGGNAAPFSKKQGRDVIWFLLPI
jgi:hypothetical protein